MLFFSNKCYNMLKNVIERRYGMEFKDQVLYVRAKLNLTQTELAKKLSVSFATINRWESGKTKPSKKAMIAMDIFCKENNIDFKKR